MSIDNIRNLDFDRINNLSFVESQLKGDKKEVSTSGDFDGFFKAALDLLDYTSRSEQDAQKLQMDYITGKTDDMLSVVLAEQRAYTALNFTVQITNKIVDSYRQIISMQV